MKKYIVTMAILALGFSACNKVEVDNQVVPVETPSTPVAPAVHQVSIPATMGTETKAVIFDGTTSISTFLSTERVYVYNVTADEVLEGYLSPTNISADGQSCDLTGTLTGTLTAGNSITLLYNLSDVDTAKEGDRYKDYTFFEYDNQDGTEDDVTDGAIATATVGDNVGEVLTTTTTVSFQNVQSMFRFKFTDGTNDINVTSLRIHSANDALGQKYRPIDNESEQYTCGDIIVSPATATTDYLYVSLRIKESSASGDMLTFTATDADGIVYQGTKAAPSAGFTNGKYYWNSTAISLTPFYKDPEGAEIIDPAVYGWLKNNRFKQEDIDALGNNAAATDQLYLCWLYNCNFKVDGAGGSVEVINTTFDNVNVTTVKTVTVQLTRKAPLGAIIGTLYLFADENALPIPDESVEFDDPHFAIAPTTDEVIQTSTATVRDVTATTISAQIIPFIPDEPEYFPEEPVENPEEDPGNESEGEE